MEDRVMVDQLRLDLLFPNEAIAAGFCVKIELLQLTLPSAITIARMHVADLGYHLAPVLNEQELLTLAASSTLGNLFSTPLLVDMEDPGTGLQARFFSVVDVNLFLQSRGSKEEYRSLGALREVTKGQKLELGPRGRHFRVKVDRRPVNCNQLQQSEIASQGPHGAIHLLFRRKQELFHFLFSSGAKQLGCVQLEVEDILGREEKKAEEIGVRVRVSWELNLQEPSLSPLPHLITLTPNGLLPLAALLEVTGGRAITGLGRVELQQVSSKITISSIAHSSRCVKEIYLEESSFLNFPGDTRSPRVCFKLHQEDSNQKGACFLFR
jgi:hypothetical protein